jgi:hypothetical protein
MARRGIAQQTAGERWIAFLRGYGPVNRIDGMFAETIHALAARYGLEPLHFEHPMSESLAGAIDPSAGKLSNVVLTGTAGDGKTSLCNELWERLGGDDRRSTGVSRDDYLQLPIPTAAGTVRMHFIFEFSGFAPPRGEPWPEDKFALLELFGRSAMGLEESDFFVIAANDGKLLQAMEGLPESGPARDVWLSMERALATRTSPRGVDRLLLLNLSQMSTRLLLERALDCLLARGEWRCFDDEGEDPAFGESSPLRANHAALSDPTFRDRLLALAELCDANGMHVSIREILLLLVNALLGDAEAPERVLRIDELRGRAIERQGHWSSIYSNVFGQNLRHARREQYAVFRHLGSFRVGQETTNLLDALLVFGAEDAALRADYERYVQSEDPQGLRTEFERLRKAYIDSIDDRADADKFLAALCDERRRLFFRLPDDRRLDPWRLTMFQSAASYRQLVLKPLANGVEVAPSVVSRLVVGLNRIWTGMLIGRSDFLWVSTGLDSSAAPVSDVVVSNVPIDRSPFGQSVEIELGDDGMPALRVRLGVDGRGAVYPLHLTRYEFLTRVADGALPNSFSKECNEDVLAFKARLLSECLAVRRKQEASGARRKLTLLVQDRDGEPKHQTLGVTV